LKDARDALTAATAAMEGKAEGTAEFVAANKALTKATKDSERAE
jgi:hypothetical protein